MIRGPRPKPTLLKIVSGNGGKRPLNRREAKPLRTLPTAPAELSDDARDEWNRVAVELHRIGLLTGVDRAALAAYCQAFGQWVEARRAIREMAKANPSTAGLTIRTSNGNVIQNPLVGIANRAAADMVKYAVEFGMTPSARSRVQATSDDEDNTFSQF